MSGAKDDDLSIKDIITLFYQWDYDDGKIEPFYFNLISTIKTANPKNRRRLDMIYPNFVYVYNLWTAAGDFGNDLFRQHKIGRFADENVIDL